MTERRTAEAALAADPLKIDVVRKFVTSGMPENADSEARGSEAIEEKSPKLSAAEADEPESTGRDRVRSRKLRRDRVGRLEASQVPQELRAALAKATVQKTVRFDPRLIAEWESLAREAQNRGEKPASFQQVQNEALKLWLDQQSRR